MCSSYRYHINDGIYSIERTDYPVICVMGTYDMGTLMEFKPLEYPRGAPHPHALKQDAYYLWYDMCPRNVPYKPQMPIPISRNYSSSIEQEFYCNPMVS